MASLSGVSPAVPLDAGALRKSLARAQAGRQWKAFGLTLPLLVFLLMTLLVPIVTLLQRAVENPEVARALPRTVVALEGWRGQESPSPAAYAALVADLSQLPDSSDAGALARRLNTEVAGARSLIMGAYRSLPIEGSPEQIRERLIQADPRWDQVPFWSAIAKNGSRWTPDYLLASVDLRRDVQGHIERMPEDQRAFGGILIRTFQISLVVTLCCLILGYPLAWWLASLNDRAANVLMILVLVPFWTSILVRVAAWMVLLQSEGLVNRGLIATGLIDAPLELLFNRTGVVIAMVHILLPFMILPLYSVMKSVPPTYQRAAVSLGSTPMAAFWRVYVPQTYPGMGAGALLVFILSIGYYVTPALVGGADDQMLSYYIARYTNVEINWGMACALGALLLTATLVLYAVYRRFSRAELSLS